MNDKNAINTINNTINNSLNNGTSIPNVMLTEAKIKRMFKQQYRTVGNHSAIKICFWTKEALRHNRHCYKHHFYGVKDHRCLEMSPAITCNQRCKHCWRDTSVFSAKWEGQVDDPKFIVEESIKERNKILMGFKGNKKVNSLYFEDSLRIGHIAISLTGEPCMYPRLVELIDEYFRKGAETVFLVTSGTVPERLREMKEKKIYPTNLYLSMESRNKEEYEKLCLPVLDNAWELVKESEEILRDMPTRTVMRITAMKGLNMNNAKGFVSSIERMQPDYIEVKGYMFLGYSMLRMKRENMPNFEEVKNYARELLKYVDYTFVDEQKVSNIVLLKRNTRRKVYSDNLYMNKIPLNRKL